MIRRLARRRRRGAVLIEFVVVLPVFLLLLLGAIDWGWYFVLRQATLNAVREGARVGSVQNTPGAAPAAAQVAVADYLTRAGLRAYASTATLATVTVGGAPVTVIQVGLVGYPAGSITGFTPTRVPATLTAQAVMRLEIQP
ncbi:MAG TPA: TadE/TadG family type IV pilus assembly protein [Anaeromyxobacteraceae bacterium]|nr:TadE/TadG family type IV pilus assembly protein [Anaeromyxobacteraceae bacterium]